MKNTNKNINQYQEAIANRIKEIIDSNNLTQKQFCEITGIHYVSLSQLFSGTKNISPCFLYPVVLNLNINPHWLETGDGFMYYIPSESCESIPLPYERKRKQEQENEVSPLDKEKSWIKKKLDPTLDKEKENKEKENYGEMTAPQSSLHKDGSFINGNVGEAEVEVNETEVKENILKESLKNSLNSLKSLKDWKGLEKIGKANAGTHANEEREELPAENKKPETRYRTLSGKSKHPFIPVEEVEEYIQGLENCLDRIDKIVINQIWDIISSELSDEVRDGDGNVIGTMKAEDYVFPADRLEKDILIPAIESAVEIIEEGGVTLADGTELPVTAKIPEDISVLFEMVDWKKTEMYRDWYTSADKSRFRNVFEEIGVKVPVETGATREQKRIIARKDYEYMSAIIRTGRDDSSRDLLTPIEWVAYIFLEDNFEIDEETCEPKEAVKRFLTRDEITRYKLEFIGEGVTLEEFLEVLSLEKLDPQGCLNIRTRMFSADKIRVWNATRNFSSVITI